MSIINYHMCAFLLATTTAILYGKAQLLDEDDDVFGRPWPTYSLQNMPKTQFTCRDKILGGYYADPETQCQMFHVCVKLPGIGVQDYRFLCPNSTAFDQELQICANWADVDCDKATAYDDNNNLNDLYRGADDSKNANEEESTFHLQRAESGDVRRSKENRKDQKPRPRHNYAQTSSDNTQTSKSRPITSYYTPTTSSTTNRPTTTTTTTTTERSYYNVYNNKENNDDSKQDIDDIFKGSHSSHFFANRHGGREFDEEPAARPRPNDFNEYNRKTTETASKTRVTPTRSQRITSTSSAATTAATTTTSAPSTKALKKITLHASFNTDFQAYKSSTPSTTSVPTTPRLGNSITSRFSFGQNDYQTQERIQPTTYNPNAYRIKSTEGKNAQDFDKETTRRNKPTVAARKQKLGPQESNYVNHNEFVELPKAKLQQPQPFQATQQTSRRPAPAQLEPQYHRPRAQDISRVGAQEPSPFKSSAKPRTFTSRGSITYKATTQHYADDEFHYPTTTSTANPSYGISKRTTQAGRDSFTPTTFKPTTYKKPYEQSYYQTQQTQRPSQNQPKQQTPSVSPKKSSAVTAALPTTANPYYNVDEDDGQYHPELYENDFPRNRLKLLRNRSGSNSASSTTTTPSPVSSRQPHGFQQAHSHLKSQQQSAYQKEREQEQDLSDEDELFKTAQSLNFGAASINKLRADIYKAEKNSQQYNSQYSPQVAPSSPRTTNRPTTTTAYPTSTTTTTTTTTTRRPTTTTKAATTTTTSTTKGSSAEPKKSKSKKDQQDKKTKSRRPPYADEDTSYDYAYYDTD
ncbi:endochitinase A isoform X2 [Drosophila grimshawi]|uniref:endochitinase A isoform X2 n=1 Tax=Drosophila grimshawi TaxID=7222 RepID=UPI000C86F6C3|nr:endochitinase A isoform X2 [Drosophila grimshawi]